MATLELSGLTTQAFQNASKSNFLELRRLVDEARKSTTLARDQKLLQDILPAIRGIPDVAQWDQSLARDFVILASSIFGRNFYQLATAPNADDLLAEQSRQKADWLCHLAAALPIEPSTEEARQKVLRAWITSRVIGVQDEPAVARVIDYARAVAGRLSMNDQAIARDVQLAVLQVFTNRMGRTSTPPAEAFLEVARVWCRALAEVPEYKRFLRKPASALGLSIEELKLEEISPSANGTETHSDPDSSTAPSARAAMREPPKLQIWTLPPVLGPEVLPGQLQDLIFDLIDPMTLKMLTPEIAREVDRLSKNPSSTAVNELSGVARDLWACFVRIGDRSALQLLERIGIYLHSYSRTLKTPDPVARTAWLTFWVRSQLPAKLLACEPHLLLADTLNVYTLEGLAAPRERIGAAIVESFAGEARARQSEKDVEGLSDLLSDNRKAIASLQRKILDERQRRRGSTPDFFEQEAFDYLMGLAVREQLANPLKSGAPVTQLIDDANFQTILRKGSFVEMYEFASAQQEKIRTWLQRRLSVSFERKALLRPTGTVPNPRNARNARNSRFTDALAALDAGDHLRAASMLGHLADTLEGRQREVAINFQGYALALASEDTRARLALMPLSESSTYPSTFWNLAICAPVEHPERRLELLEMGLKRAPHPTLLRGAIYLALNINDIDTLRHWLPYVTLLEALLLHYQLEYENLDDAERERLVDRLAKTAYEGEIRLPSLKDRIRPHQIEEEIDKCLARYQPEPVEFWLACQEPTNRRNVDYWRLKTHFLLERGDQAGAARSFREELRFILEDLQNALNATSDPREAEKAARYLRQHLRQAKTKVLHHLSDCTSDDLAEVGSHIFDNYQLFVEGQAEKLRALKIDEEIKDSKLLDFFETRRRTSGQQRASADARQRAAGLSEIAIRVAAACQSRLHNLSHLPLLQSELQEIVTAYREFGNPKSEQSLREILRQFDLYREQDSRDGKEQIWRASEMALREHEAALKLETSEQFMTLVQPLLKALGRVVMRLPRDAQLLPKLGISPVHGDKVRLDGRAVVQSFAIRIHNSSDTTRVRLLSGSSHLVSGEGDISVICRDNFEAQPLVVAEQSDAILSFELVGRERRITLPATIRVSVTADLGGASFDTESDPIELVDEPLDELPSASPYIHSRMIEVNEIEGHFFGRSDEQAKILNSVRDGQQQFHYIEGLRRTGKSSLLQSVLYEIEKQSLPLIPIYHGIGAARVASSAGIILFNILCDIAAHPELKAHGIAVPEERRFIENMSSAYQTFVTTLGERMPDKRVLVLVDDFQALAEMGQEAATRDTGLFRGIVGLLDLIRQHGRPSARLLWVFAGHTARGQFRRMIPGPNFWTHLRGIEVDFLAADAVANIVRRPLQSFAVEIPDQTITRLHQLTGGHPEVVQQVSELMYHAISRERRRLVTPADADRAVAALAGSSDDLFADTWYPAHMLSSDQRDLVAAFVRAVKPGGSVELFKLGKRGEMTEALESAATDLIHRKILRPNDDGTVSVRAYVLDLWLRRWVGRDVGVNQQGAPVAFIDVPNIVGPDGEPYLTDLKTRAGEGITGKFSLGTVLDRVDRYIRTITPAERAVSWAINYPPYSPAVVVVSGKGYYVQNISEDLKGKGSDDTVLQGKIFEVEQQFPAAKHFILMLGDKDYQVSVKRLVDNGKSVHIISRQQALANRFQILARQYPDRVTAVSIEEIMENPAFE